MITPYSSLDYSWLSHQLVELAQCLLAEFNLAPDAIQIDGIELPIAPLSASQISASQYHVIVNWYEPKPCQFSLEKPDTLRITNTFAMPDVEQVVNWLAQLPFEVCIGADIFDDWPKKKHAILFPGQYPLGWMVAFKGVGHKYIVSPRWLDQASVRVYRKGDLTLVQLYDLNATPEIALMQAQHNWPLFNCSVTSGFLGSYSCDPATINGQYNPEDGSLYFTVSDREITFEELKDVCYAKHFLEREDGKAINKIIYVFFAQDRAQRWLHELWIRDLECHAFIDGKEVNLTDNYQPPSKNLISW